MNLVYNKRSAVNIDKMVMAIWQDETEKADGMTPRRVILFLDAGKTVIEKTFENDQADSVWRYITAGHLCVEKG